MISVQHSISSHNCLKTRHGSGPSMTTHTTCRHRRSVPAEVNGSGGVNGSVGVNTSVDSLAASAGNVLSAAGANVVPAKAGGVEVPAKASTNDAPG